MCRALNTLKTQSCQISLGDAGMTHNPQQDGPLCCQVEQGVHFSSSYWCGLTCRITFCSNTFLMVFSICLRKT